MKEKKKKNYRFLYRLIRLVLILIPILLFIWLFKSNILVGDTLEYHNDFSKDYPFISEFFPEGRAVLENGIYEISLEPIYFNVYYPRNFKKATVKIVYKNEAGQLLRIGVRQPGDWSYYFQTLEDENFRPQSINGWREGELIFDLSDVLVEKNKLRFIISLPNLETNQNKIFVKSLDVILSK